MEKKIENMTLDEATESLATLLEEKGSIKNMTVEERALSAALYNHILELSGIQTGGEE